MKRAEARADERAMGLESQHLRQLQELQELLAQCQAEAQQRPGTSQTSRPGAAGCQGAAVPVGVRDPPRCDHKAWLGGAEASHRAPRTVLDGVCEVRTSKTARNSGSERRRPLKQLAKDVLAIVML